MRLRWRDGQRWLALILLGLIGLAGYYGPWVPHRAAGLVILGLDLAEYVKFLPPVISGEIALRREMFYLALFASSVGASLIASRSVLPRWGRWLLGLGAIPLALAMLPPAWSPAVLRLPEFRLQVVAIIVCVLLVVAIPLLHRLSDRLVLRLIGVLALAAAVLPAWGFLRVLSPIEALYNHPIRPGWGFWATMLGFGAAGMLALMEAVRSRR